MEAKLACEKRNENKACNRARAQDRLAVRSLMRLAAKER